MAFNPFSQDPTPVDQEYPTSLIPLVFPSYNSPLLGHLRVAQRRGPHPTVLLLHGFPGDEQHGDLAHLLCRAGWNVMTFHYRGAWGSSGDFSFAHAFEDVQTAVTLLRSKEMVEKHRVDPSRIILIGHSMGGFAALLTTIYDQEIQATASMAGFHFGVFAQMLRTNSTLRQETVQDWQSVLTALHGAASERLVQETLDHQNDWTLTDKLDQLVRRPVLLIGAENDTIAPPDLHHTPLIQAFNKLNASHLISAILPTDHSFANSRVTLAKHLLNWLQTL